MKLGAKSGGLGDGSPNGVQGRIPDRGSGERSPPEAEAFKKIHNLKFKAL